VISDDYFDQFETVKYRRRGRLRRTLIRRFARTVLELVQTPEVVVQSVLEVGIGEGFLSGVLSERFPGARFVGVDSSAESLARVKGRFPWIEVRVGTAYDLSAVVGPFDLVVCAEVLEHLENPARALDEVANLRPRYAMLTVPHEPFFRLSHLAAGENLARWGNDPEHIQHFGRRSLRSLLERRFDVVTLRGSFPWLLALATPR
jgi:2-polyprenyl-3-methyl-5-hydroxy-6-metoxy-1,4-benzoquinol methylase